jgi:hypothetical protein
VAITDDVRIRRIVITKSKIPGMEEETPSPTAPVIDDPDRIARITEFLVARSRGWRAPSDTFPIHAYNITLEIEHGPPIYLWDGGNWIGGPMEDGNRLRTISLLEMDKFHDLLGIPRTPAPKKAP